MNIVIDQGNTSAKIGIFEQHVLKEKYTFTKSEEVKSVLENFSGGNLIISSVNRDAYEFAQLTQSFSKTFILTPTLPLPIENLYGSPSTLGMDRLAGVCGAWNRFPNEHTLVIDAGTCVTFDFINSSGQFLGGAISPGLMMRFKAMHSFTARLPLTGPVEYCDLIGDNTTACMQSGVIHGMLDEIDGMIARYEQKFGQLKVIFCGGDTAFFENRLKASIFAGPELVLEGLNSILLYNANR